MKHSPYTIHTLKNRVTLITQQASVDSVTVNIAIGAGSRYETCQTVGTAHFLEHMLFEGTKTLSSPKELAEYIENVGGRSGAWTDKEYVSYHVKIPKQHIERAFNYLSDILFHPVLSNAEIEKEKGIILEEIKHKGDNPEIDIWDQSFEWTWGGDQPLGFSTLGDPMIIQKVTQKRLREYLDTFYHPANMAIAVVGNFSPKDVEEYVQKYFGDKQPKITPLFRVTKFIPRKPLTKIINITTQQLQSVLNFVTDVSYSHRDRFALQLIADTLSAGTSSRLFHRLIYELGIAYTSWAQSFVYRDTGIFCVYGSFSPENISLALQTIIQELKKIKSGDISEKELQETKEKAKANFIFSLETPDALANWYASCWITEKKITTIADVIKNIDSVTIKDIIRTANTYLVQKNLRLTIRGPLKEDRVDSIEKILTQL